MIVRSDVLTADLIRAALVETRYVDHEDIHLDEDGIHEFKPRKFAHGFKFYCESFGGRRARNGRPGHAATWTAYGQFMARLYRIDPRAEVAWYSDLADFITKTEQYQPRGEDAPWLADGELRRLA